MTRRSTNEKMIALKDYIENFVSLAKDEWEQTIACTEIITLGKTEIFITANSRFKKEIFVQNGIVRAYIVDNDGNEKTTAFFRKMNS